MFIDNPILKEQPSTQLHKDQQSDKSKDIIPNGEGT